MATGKRHVAIAGKGSLPLTLNLALVPPGSPMQAGDLVATCDDSGEVIAWRPVGPKDIGRMPSDTRFGKAARPVQG